MNHDPIIRFFSGARDDRGRRLDEILRWSDDQLEEVHDYIQWLFPTRQPSGVNPFAPLVTDGTAAAFDADASLRARLVAALDRMLRFYGLTRADQRIVIDAGRFEQRAADWLTPGNHNHLRLTRIMQSLDALGLERDARALQRCLLEDIASRPNAVTARTIEFWRDALD